jgi:hypothetical protein
MKSAFDTFKENIKRAENFGGIYVALSQRVTSALDLSDLLRAQIVQGVSAFDHYIHEITRIGMNDILVGNRPITPSFKRFSVSMEAYLSSAASANWFDGEIRGKHGHLSFQMPDKVADAIRLVADKEIWKEIGKAMRKKPEPIKQQLRLIVDRRNKIAHEADIDPSAPGVKWPISKTDADDSTSFLEKLGSSIYNIVK